MGLKTRKVTDALGSVGGFKYSICIGMLTVEWMGGSSKSKGALRITQVGGFEIQVQRL